MRHLKKVKKFNRDQEHRKAMFSNMVVSLFRHGRIKTTTEKAKELRRLSERVITRAKENTLHNKRLILGRLKDRNIVAKLFDEIAPRYKGINGGYTRIIRLGTRVGDSARLSLIELVDFEKKPKQKKKQKKKEATSQAPATS